MITGTMTGVKKLAKLLQDAAPAADHAMQAGIFEDAIYPDGVPVAQAAYENEYGTLEREATPVFRQVVASASGVAEAAQEGYRMQGAQGAVDTAAAQVVSLLKEQTAASGLVDTGKRLESYRYREAE